MRTYIYDKAFQRCPKAPLEGFVSIYNYASYAARNTPPKMVGISMLTSLQELAGLRYVGKVWSIYGYAAGFVIFIISRME